MLRRFFPSDAHPEIRSEPECTKLLFGKVPGSPRFMSPTNHCKDEGHDLHFDCSESIMVRVFTEYFPCHVLILFLSAWVITDIA